MSDRARWTPFDVAAFHERVAAGLIDVGILWALWAGGMIWLVETGELGTPPRLASARALVWLAAVCVVACAYDAASLHLWGSSVGRRIVGIEVRSETGGLPDGWRSVVRSVVRLPAVALLGAGLLPLRTDRQRRAVHDRLAGTVVVRSDAVERLAGDGAGGLVIVETAADVDASERAIRRAGVPAGQAGWLRTIADQTEVRLDIVSPSWRRADDPAAIHSRAFCLLLTRLVERYPDQRAVIVGVLDNHDELLMIDGDREPFLERLLAEPERARRWIGLPDSTNMRIVLDEPAHA